MALSRGKLMVQLATSGNHSCSKDNVGSMNSETLSGETGSQSEPRTLPHSPETVSSNIPSYSALLHTSSDTRMTFIRRSSSNANLESTSKIDDDSDISSDYDSYMPASPIDDTDEDPHFEPLSDSDSTDEENGNSSDIVGSSPSLPSTSAPSGQESTDTQILSPSKKRGKKRPLQKSKWIKEVSKQLRNSGKEYVSASKSKKCFDERKMFPPCTLKCRLQCSSKFTEEERTRIFEKYWELGDLEKQRSFIAGNVECYKYRYVNPNKYRQMNNAFYLYNIDTKVRVCKLFFRNTLGINDRPIRTVLTKKVGGFMEIDRRGKHGNHKQVDQSIKDSVKKHIESIPRVESHYTRAHTTREFIPGDKSLADLHRDYLKMQEENNEPAANLIMYSRIFNKEYNISFFVPKKDLCNLCEAFKNAPYDVDLKAKCDAHEREKVLSRQAKEDDKHQIDNKNFIVCTFDLQAVMPCPAGDVSIFYYKSKINCYNFTISQLGSDIVECFFWNECEGQRGANEIGTCLWLYLQKIAALLDNEHLELTFFCDNCCGQNKNKFILSLLLHAVRTLNIRKITLKFLICGHTQNEGDAVHSVIEKQIKKAKKAGPIYIPQQYATLIRTAKKKGRPFTVNELAHSDFLDIKRLTAEMGGTKALKDSIGNPLQLSKIKVVKFEKLKPSSFSLKYSYDQIDFHEVEIKARGNKQYSLHKVYSKKFPLNERKKKTACLCLILNTYHKVMLLFFLPYKAHENVSN